MSHISPIFRSRFSTFEQLDEYLDRYDYDRDLLFRYLVLHDAGAQLIEALARPIAEGGLGEEAVGHGSWAQGMGIEFGNEWTAGLAEVPGISKAHLAARYPRDVDLFFPGAIELDPKEHENRTMAAVRALVADSTDPAKRRGLPFVRYVPDDEFRWSNGAVPPDFLYNSRWPGQVWGNLRAIPLDSSGNPLPERAVGVSLDVHPPDKIPLPIGTVRPVRSAIPVDVPGFRPSRLRLVPPEQQLVNKALLLTESQEYTSFDQRAKHLIDALYSKKSLGEVSRDRVVAVWDARWWKFHPGGPAPDEFHILDPDSPEWEVAYEGRKRDDPHLTNYPPCETAIGEVTQAINQVRAAPPGSIVNLASGAWRMPNHGYGSGKPPRAPRNPEGERHRVAPRQWTGSLRSPRWSPIR